MSVLGVVLALPAEGRALMGERTWKSGGGSVCRVHLPEGGSIIARRGGIGPGKAREAARELLGEGATVLASLGVAGGLQPDLAPGTIVVVDTVIDPDGIPLKVDLQWTMWWSHRLARGGDFFRRGNLCTVERPVLTAEAKAQLHRQSGALAVDMESAAVAWAAREAGFPFFCLRAVCDPAQRTLPADLLHLVSANGSIRLPELLRRLAHRPALGMEMVRAAKDYAAAIAALKRLRLTCLRMLPGSAAGESLDEIGPIGKLGGPGTG